MIYIYYFIFTKDIPYPPKPKKKSIMKSQEKKLPEGCEWWHTPIIPMLWKGEFKISLGHTAKSRPELH